MTKKKVISFFQEKLGVTPSVAALGDTNPSDATDCIQAGQGTYRRETFYWMLHWLFTTLYFRQLVTFDGSPSCPSNQKILYTPLFGSSLLHIVHASHCTPVSVHTMSKRR